MKETSLSLVRHAATLLGGWLLAKGYVGDSIAAWLPGALFVLSGSIWGAVDEYKATGRKLHFWLSIVRHTLTTAGGCFATLGKISAESVEGIIGVILALTGAIWGAGDEYTHNTQHPGTGQPTR